MSRVDGTRTGIPVERAVTIARDGRGVPHIRAACVHDLLVAEGYAMASDRLFQMDLTRRFVQGRLAELLGSPLVRVDERMRRYAVADLAARVYARARPGERVMLEAFADGVNAAARAEPRPPEYAALFAGFEWWRPQDALAVGFATVLDLDDKPDDVAVRDEVRRVLGAAGTDAFYPLTDGRYDVPTDGSAAGAVAALPALPGAAERRARVGTRLPLEANAVGSNAWVAGGDRTTSGRAVLANDPHLDIAIPGIWWLVEAEAPGLHVAGAALAGTPGVTLGHNEHLAWGVTAGETAAMRVVRLRTRGTDEFLERGGWQHARHRLERIPVRFGRTVQDDILETASGTVFARAGGVAYAMDWPMRRSLASPLAPFLALMRAGSAAAGVAAMRALPEPALNVVYADDRGNVAYHLAGRVPLDPSWGRWAVDPTAPGAAQLSYDRAPQAGPRRDLLIVTSNNRASGAAEPRLAPYWQPPYRAYEVTTALHAAGPGGRLSIEELAAEQRDATSPAEREFAGLVLDAVTRTGLARDGALAPFIDAVRSFDGRLVPESRGATAVVALRRELVAALARDHLSPDLAAAVPATAPGFEIVLRALRERPRGWVPHDDYDAFVAESVRSAAARFPNGVPEFGAYAALPLRHPLAAFGFRLWNGPTLPGRGGSFAPAVQWDEHAQSFRAVWIAGDWDAGTIDVDAGESGEPGSPHYADQTRGWTHFARTTLPFSDAAVRAATRSVLTLAR